MIVIFLWTKKLLVLSSGDTGTSSTKRYYYHHHTQQDGLPKALSIDLYIYRSIDNEKEPFRFQNTAQRFFYRDRVLETQNDRQ